MIKPWFEAACILSKVETIINRRSVPSARAQLTKKTPKTTHNTTQKQLLVDISVIYQNDSGTGIQRVVRALLTQLLSTPPAGYIVQPIIATRKSSYRAISLDTSDSSLDTSKLISIQPGDIFLGLDLSAHIIPAHHNQLSKWKTQGAVLHFVVYDILPIHHPEWFSRKLSRAFRRWIKTIAILADSAICISASSEADLVKCFRDQYNLPTDCIPTKVIPMGWDISSSNPSKGLPLNFEALLSQIKLHNTILIVGTLEPRKGHVQVLDAFEVLWQDGNNLNLIIVGQSGWKTEVLQARIQNHPYFNKHLFWLDKASDEALIKLYQACDGVIVASLAEGFGLPLIEAISHGKPVLARDLAVFKEIAGHNVDYFAEVSATGLSLAITNWVKIKFGIQPSKVDFLYTWEDSYNQLVRILINNLSI